MKYLAIVLLFLSQTSFADVSLSVGLGYPGALQHTPFDRMFAVGYLKPLGPVFTIKGEFGGWFGNDGAQSLFVGAPVGATVFIKDTGFYARVSVGPSWVFNAPDAYLGSHFEFDNEYVIGKKNSWADINLAWHHFSDAGLTPVNHGRDFLCLQLELSGI